MRPSLKPQGSSPIKAKTWSFDEIRTQLRWAGVDRPQRRWIIMEPNHIEQKKRERESPAHTATADLCSGETGVIYAKNVFHCRRCTPNGCQFLHWINVLQICLISSCFIFLFAFCRLQFTRFHRDNLFSLFPLFSDYLANYKGLVCEEIHFRNFI